MRYALISFLNARPLWWGLVHGDSRDEESYLFSSPAQCSELIAAGEADLGLIPAIDLARNDQLFTVPGLCIASESEVRSVLLVARVPFEEIRSVMLDPASRTSVALCRILLAERLEPDLYESVRFDEIEGSDRAATLAGLLSDHDAAVVIGDPALLIGAYAAADDSVHRYDLASEWYREFGEPFVFAVWAGRRDRLESHDPGSVRQRLEESLEYGFDHLSDIVEQAAEELELSTQDLTEYFEHSLHYSLGEGERSALERFHRLAREYGLADNREEIKWFE